MEEKVRFLSFVTIFEIFWSGSLFFVIGFVKKGPVKFPIMLLYLFTLNKNQHFLLLFFIQHNGFRSVA